MKPFKLLFLLNVLVLATNCSKDDSNSSPSAPPIEQTLAVLAGSNASEVTLNTATISGNISDNGGSVITNKGVVFNTAPNPTINNSSITDPSEGNAVTITITDLEENTTYYARIFATNSTGTSYSNDIIFSTLQNVFSGDVFLESQAEVDEFASNDYEGITGSLFIEGLNSNDISDLSGLSALTFIGSRISLSNLTLLTSLNGLQNVQGEGTEFFFFGNNLITNLNELDGLGTLGAKVTIANNDLLESLDGLTFPSQLERVVVSGNDVLTSITAMAPIQSVSGTLSIMGNNQLTTLQGLNNLETVSIMGISGDSLLHLDDLNNFTTATQLNITDTNSLTSLSGLESVVNISQILYIYNNQALLSLDGLNNLESIGLSFNLENNNQLTDLGGLSSLTTVNQNIYFRENLLLQNLDGLESLVELNGLFEITDNPNLTDYCGIRPSTVSGAPYSLFATGNAYNPFKSDIAQGNCSI